MVWTEERISISTVLTMLQRFRARETPIRPKLRANFALSREEEANGRNPDGVREDLVVFTEESGSGTRVRR